MIFFRIPKSRKSKLVYVGHFSYGTINKYLEPEDKIASVIREPVERALSFYNHMLSPHQNHPLHSEVKDRSLTDALTTSPRFASEMKNLMCQYLSGKRNCEGTIDVVKARGMKLYGMDQLGLMTKYVGEFCGVSRISDLTFANAAVNDYMSSVTTEEVELVRQLNEEDCKFYSFFMNDYSAE